MNEFQLKKNVLLYFLRKLSLGEMRSDLRNEVIISTKDFI